MEIKKNSSSGKKLQQGCQLLLTDASRQKPFRLGEVKSKSLGETNSWSDNISSATNVNYKNTCIIVLDSSVLKDPLVIQLLTRLLEIMLLFLPFRECFGSLEEAT